MDTRNEGKPSPTDDEWGDEPLVEVMRKKHRTDGARLALEAAKADVEAGIKDLSVVQPVVSSSVAMLCRMIRERLAKRSPESIVLEAEAKEVDR